ncbi:NAD-dependent epimerase/dehydratase family protein [Herminiimonas sp. NPDC097707]|uniref:NAD-dependent epimerase/dehydratase family protein n=1 Tax=Herminiimonas sp. NPDC097707 TaxID=3364007 RepID=UPI003839E6D6
MKVLLTGARGNFGTEFLKLADCDVVQFGRDEWHAPKPELFSGVDVVVHAASDLHTKIGVSPTRLIDSNLTSTARLLESAREHRIPRFVFLSSCAVYGEDMRTNEDHQCSPVSLNGTSKLLNERMIAEFCSVNDIKYEILRIFNMYGGHDNFSIVNHLKKSLDDDSPFTLNNGGIAQRDFIHVADVAFIVFKLLQMNIPYSYLNIGTGTATKISTLIDLAQRRFPALSIQHAQTREAEYSRADITKLREFINIDFVKIENYMNEHFMKGNEGR